MPKLVRLVPAALLALSLCALAPAQKSNVRTEYLKGEKKTKVETGLLYLLNTPEQLVQVQLTALYKGEKLVQPPDKITLTIFSLAKKEMYRAGDRGLTVVADGEAVKGGTLTRMGLKGETKGGQNTFYLDDRPAIGMQIPVPPSAQVSGGGGVNGLVMEIMIVEIKPEQFARLAGAKEAALRVGKADWKFTEGQMNIVREFAGSITPR